MAGEKETPSTFGELTTENSGVVSDEEATETETAEEGDSSDGEGDKEDVQSEDSEDSDEESDDDESDVDDAEEESEDEDEEAPVKEKRSKEEENADTEEEFEEMSKKDKNKELHEVKVDGKIERVSLKELKESFSSRASNARAVQKFQEERKEYQAKLQKINDTLAPAWKALKEDKFEDAFLELAKLKGKSTLEIKRQLRRELAPSIVAYLKMSEQERRQFDLSEENEYYRSLVESKKKESDLSQQNAQAEGQILQLQAKHGISDEELDYAMGWLEENTFKANPKAITPEHVLEAVMTARAINKAFEAVRVKRPSLEKNEGFMDRVIRHAKANSGISVAELARYIEKKASGLAPKNKDAQELAKDISRKVLKAKPKSSFESPEKPKKPQSFSDLELP